MFYRLTEKELIQVSAQLTDAELRVWLLLCTRLPFANREIEIDTAELAELLGVSRRTAQRALKRIDDLELFGVEITRAKVRRHQDRRATPGSPGDTRIARATPGSLGRHQDRQRGPEPAPVGGSEPSKINKINQISLSDQRESLEAVFSEIPEEDRTQFRAYCDQKIAKAPWEIASPKAWLLAHWQEYWAEYQKVARAAFVGEKPSGEILAKIERAIASGKLRALHYSSLLESWAVVHPGGWQESVSEWLAGGQG